MKLKINPNAKAYNGTDDFWYALFDGGYIKPESMIADSEQVLKIKEAMKVLRDFRTSLELAGLYDPS